MNFVSCQLFSPREEEPLCCPICYDSMVKPVLAQCGHCFCKGCIEQWILESPECPICRRSIDTDGQEFEDEESVLKYVGQLEVCCENHNSHPEGCEWRGKLSEMKHHLQNECQCENVKCPNGSCPFTSLRAYLSLHLHECEFELVKCKHCKIEIAMKDLPDHYRAINSQA